MACGGGGDSICGYYQILCYFSAYWRSDQDPSLRGAVPRRLLLDRQRNLNAPSLLDTFVAHVSLSVLEVDGPAQTGRAGGNAGPLAGRAFGRRASTDGMQRRCSAAGARCGGGDGLGRGAPVGTHHAPLFPQRVIHDPHSPPSSAVLINPALMRAKPALRRGPTAQYLPD